jgi:hypothetical protein
MRRSVRRLSLISLLPGEVNGMLEKAEHAILQRPIVIAMVVITHENTGGGSDLLGRLATLVGDTSLRPPAGT